MISMTEHSTAMSPWCEPGVRADGCLSSPSSGALARSSTPTRWSVAHLVRSLTVRDPGGNAPIEPGKARLARGRRPQHALGSLCFARFLCATQSASVCTPCPPAIEREQCAAGGEVHGSGGPGKEPCTERRHDGNL